MDGGHRHDVPGGAGQGGGLIGPNALLQLAPVLDAALGPDARRRIFAVGGYDGLPAAFGMIPEAGVAGIHQAVRGLPQARTLLAAAGGLTGDYILAHRIPPVAQRILRALPARIAVPLLTRAIARHSWTFAGSGRFRVVSRWPAVVEIADNPLTRSEESVAPLCIWHAAVFRRLYAALALQGARVTEVACCACGDPACRFEITRGARA
ncbi:MAG: bacteriochlorophyll 4-vinyl reductase [Paracoccaceae bacterium]|nr:bacteriochlorophyll 4-vinyl reductase [Paracoccaceae bacterium]